MEMGILWDKEEDRTFRLASFIKPREVVEEVIESSFDYGRSFCSGKYRDEVESPLGTFNVEVNVNSIRATTRKIELEGDTKEKCSAIETWSSSTWELRRQGFEWKFHNDPIGKCKFTAYRYRR